LIKFRILDFDAGQLTFEAAFGDLDRAIRIQRSELRRSGLPKHHVTQRWPAYLQPSSLRYCPSSSRQNTKAMNAAAIGSEKKLNCELVAVSTTPPFGH